MLYTKIEIYNKKCNGIRFTKDNITTTRQLLNTFSLTINDYES